jgi:hypothetical protein
MTAEGILGTMKPNRDYQVSNIARCFNVGADSIRPLLEQSADAGHVRRIPTPRGVCYRLIDFKASELEVVKAPYQNLRLSENLTNYDRTNHDFAALCMMVRK